MTQHNNASLTRENGAARRRPMAGPGQALAVAVLAAALAAGCAARPAPEASAGAPVAAPTVAPSPDLGANPGPTAVQSAAASNNAGPLRGYRIGPDDLLAIQVFGVEELSKEVRVDARGYIMLPLVGRVHAGGLTSEELATEIAELLAKDYLQEPDVSIFIREFTTQRITVDGAVVKPGIYPIKGETTLLQAIASASGLDKRADRNHVYIFRRLPNGQKQMYTYDVDQIRNGGVADTEVLGDDIVVAQVSGGRELLTNSMLRDFVDFLNPFKVFGP